MNCSLFNPQLLDKSGYRKGLYLSRKFYELLVNLQDNSPLANLEGLINIDSY